MVYWDFRKWIYISIENPLKTMKKLKGVFKPLNLYFRITFKEYNYYPVLWCSKPAYIHIMFQDVMWKDKNNSPQYEVPPYIWIHLYKLNLVWYWDLSPHQYKEIDDYWEQALWYLFYYEDNYLDNNSKDNLNAPDINKARENWPWRDYETKLSSWNDKFLIKN